MPATPPEADLKANIRTAEQRYDLALEFALRGSGSAMVSHIVWFRDQVRKFGPWDYNHSPLRPPDDIKKSTFDAYGNFQYGATGAAGGFDLETLQRAAGRAQGGGDVKGDGGQSGGLVGVFTGIGAKAPVIKQSIKTIFGSGSNTTRTVVTSNEKGAREDAY
jgi:hypothetical protein